MKTLIVVDMQNDFVKPAGALFIGGSEGIIPIVNRHINTFRRNGDDVVYTRDWHPRRHISFALRHEKEPFTKVKHHDEDLAIWPVHCERGTWGAAFAEGLDIVGPVFPKGMDVDVEELSAVSRPSTPLSSYLVARNPGSVHVCGVATDFCVKAHVLDLIHRGWTTHVLVDAIAGVGPVTDVLKDFEKKGAILESFTEVNV